MCEIKLKSTKKQTRQTNKQKSLIDTHNSIIVTRGKWGGEIVREKGFKYMVVAEELTFGSWACNAI